MYGTCYKLPELLVSVGAVLWSCKKGDEYLKNKSIRKMPSTSYSITQVSALAIRAAIAISPCQSSLYSSDFSTKLEITGIPVKTGTVTPS